MVDEALFLKKKAIIKEMKKPHLRTAVVGVGYLGRFHAQKHKALQEQSQSQTLAFTCELVGVCDSSPLQAEKVAAELSTKSFSRVEDLIGQVDAVSIATITPAHYELALKFLKAGIHVNVEKPIALKCAESEELVRLAREKNLTLAVGHSERYSPVFQEFRKRLHQPKALELSRHAPFNRRGSDVSVLHDLMIHDLDLMLSLDSTQSRCVSASGGKIVTDTVDWAIAHFEFESGLKAFVSCSRIGAVMSRRIKAYHAHGAMTADFQTGDLEWTEALQDTGPEVSPVKIQTLSVGRGDNLLLETEAFFNAIVDSEYKNKSSFVTGTCGHKALQKVEEILAVLQTQRGY